MPSKKSLTLNFPKNVKALRAGKGLSQSEFATLVGIAPSYVSMLENGQRVPSLDQIDQIAHACNVNPVSLVD